MPDNRGNHILARLDEMRHVKTEFDRRWKVNNKRVFGFTVDDGAFHTSNAFRMIETMTDDITNDFDGSVNFVPKMESGVREGFQFDYFSRIYNQLNQTIGIQQERKMAVKDSLRYGKGWIFEGYLRKEEEKDSFEYLFTERVDPRHMYWDNSALRFYDPQGLSGAIDVIRQRWYTPDSMKRNFVGNEKFDQAALKKILENQMTIEEQKTFKGMKKVSSAAVGSKTEEAGISLLEQNELISGVICVYEYWSHEGGKDILRMYARGEVFYDNESPYDGLPFVQYTPFLEYETVNPPSYMELISPYLKLKETLANLWYMNARMSSTPVIFADSDTGLVSGTALRPGVQTVELKGQNLRDKVQQIQLGQNGDSLINFMGFIEDELTKASGQDQRALNSKPNELATQTLQKVENELKSLRGIINTMVIGAETQRATMRGKNMLRYVLKDTKEVVLSDMTVLPDGQLKAAEGSQATVTLNDADWRNFEYDVIVRSNKQNAVLKQEEQQQLLRALEIANAFVADPNIPPEEKARMQVSSIYEQVFKTFDDLDTTKIFTQDKGVSRVQDDIERLKGGERPDGGFPDRRGKEDAMKSVAKNIGDGKSMTDKNSLQYLISLNDEKPEKLSQEESQEVPAR